MRQYPSSWHHTQQSDSCRGASSGTRRGSKLIVPALKLPKEQGPIADSGISSVRVTAPTEAATYGSALLVKSVVQATGSGGLPCRLVGTLLRLPEHAAPLWTWAPAGCKYVVALQPSKRRGAQLRQRDSWVSRSYRAHMASSCVLELAGSLHTDVVLKVSPQDTCQLAGCLSGRQLCSTCARFSHLHCATLKPSILDLHVAHVRPQHGLVAHFLCPSSESSTAAVVNCRLAGDPVRCQLCSRRFLVLMLLAALQVTFSDAASSPAQVRLAHAEVGRVQFAELGVIQLQAGVPGQLQHVLRLSGTCVGRLLSICFEGSLQQPSSGEAAPCSRTCQAGTAITHQPCLIACPGTCSPNEGHSQALVSELRPHLHAVASRALPQQCTLPAGSHCLPGYRLFNVALHAAPLSCRDAQGHEAVRGRTGAARAASTGTLSRPPAVSAPCSGDAGRGRPAPFSCGHPGGPPGHAQELCAACGHAAGRAQCCQPGRRSQPYLSWQRERGLRGWQRGQRGRPGRAASRWRAQEAAESWLWPVWRCLGHQRCSRGQHTGSRAHRQRQAGARCC